ncbi:histidine phosphatase family protein [Chloroflexi bacterium TSY]|nr:histidine phosphatase family protein [Chloroflexi bacterium TSY]
MNKTLYIIRHCKALGQAPDAALTEEGQQQATILAQEFTDHPIERIVSSPYLRAKQSVLPLAQQLDLEIELDSRLAERVLSTVDLADWRAQLRATFADFDLCLEGGETSHVAQKRGISVLHEIIQDTTRATAIVTHGNLMTLILHYFDNSFGFDQWSNLTNPDVYRLIIDGSRHDGNNQLSYNVNRLLLTD